MRVLIICEDYRTDAFILKPIIAAMMKQLGKPKAKVDFPKKILGGVSEALNWKRIKDIIDDYPMVDLFLLIVDRDGNEDRENALKRIENLTQNDPDIDCTLFGENAWQEIEVWALAGVQDLPSEWNWKEIRQEVHPKEVYFLPYSRNRNLISSPGQGRQILGEQAANEYKRVRQFCPDDIQNLETRIDRWMANLK